MKILQVIPALASGGGERFTVDLSNELVKRGHKVVLVTLFNIEEKKIWSFYKDDINSKVKLIYLNKKLGFDYKIYYAIYKLIKKEKPNIVHSHLSAFRYLFPSCVLFKKIKFIHTLHSDANKLLHSNYDYKLSKVLYKKWIKPICISEESEESYKHLYGYSNSTLIVNGRNELQKSSLFEEVKLFFNTIRKNDEKIILHIGRLSKEKNQENLVKAINKINEKNVRVKLLILGEGDPEIKNTLLNLIKNEAIFVLGSKKNVSDYLFLSDAFILTSLYEGMPISLIEAFSVGCFPICTGVGGMKNMIEHNQNGIIIPSTEVDSIVNSIEYYLSLNEDKIAKISRNAISDYEKYYSIVKCCDNYLEIYEDKKGN